MISVKSLRNLISSWTYFSSIINFIDNLLLLNPSRVANLRWIKKYPFILVLTKVLFRILLFYLDNSIAGRNPEPGMPDPGQIKDVVTEPALPVVVVTEANNAAETNDDSSAVVARTTACLLATLFSL